jgi:DUF971 family protein
MSTKNTIKQIDVDSARQIFTIVWGDNVIAEYPMDGLRRVCPCVYCRGGHDYMNKRMNPNELGLPSRKNWTIRDIKISGNYAIQITWEDGHNTGLYRFDALRQLWDDYCANISAE